MSINKQRKDNHTLSTSVEGKENITSSSFLAYSCLIYKIKSIVLVFNIRHIGNNNGSSITPLDSLKFQSQKQVRK